MKKEQDVFDRIMSLKCFRFANPFYYKYKEILLYLFFGGLAFVVSILSYAFFEKIVKFTPLIANLFSWLFAVAFAYTTNRVWVFESNVANVMAFFKEATSFFGGRIATLVVEEIILFVGINLLHVDSMFVKIVAQIVIIILNYFISKFFVFKTQKEKKEK